MCLAIPGKILDIFQQDDLPMGKVEFGGITKDVCLAYTPEARVGQYVIVHVGFSLNVIDEDEAREIFSYFDEMDEAARQEEAEGHA